MPASNRVREHIRQNIYGLLAVFIALGGTAYAVDGPLPGQNKVGSADIIDSEVYTRDLRTNAVTGNKVSDGSLGGIDIADESVGWQDLGPNSVGNSEIADNQVTGAHVVTDSLTGSDIANESVGWPELGPNSVGGSELAEPSIQSAQVFDGSLTGQDIENGTLASGDIADTSVFGVDLVPNTLGDREIDSLFTETFSFNVGDDDWWSAQVPCPAGSQLMSGGADGGAGGAARVGEQAVVSSFRDPSNPNLWRASGWIVDCGSGCARTVTVRVFAYCLS